MVDGEGKPVLETKVASDPEAIAIALKRCGGEFERVGFEAGPLSQWLYFGLHEADFPAVCIEARRRARAGTLRL